MRSKSLLKLVNWWNMSVVYVNLSYYEIKMRGHDATKMSRDTRVRHSNRMCGIFTV